MEESFFETQVPATEANTEQGSLFAVEPTLFDVEEKEKATPVNIKYTCCFCGIAVDIADESTYSETLSWVHGKKKDSSVLRTYTGRYACDPCVRVARSGIDPREPNVFDLVEEPAVSLTVGDKALFTDRTPAYSAGFVAGMSGNPDKVDPSSMDSDWKEGYVDATEQRSAEERIGGTKPTRKSREAKGTAS